MSGAGSEQMGPALLILLLSLIPNKALPPSLPPLPPFSSYPSSSPPPPLLLLLVQLDCLLFLQEQIKDIIIQLSFCTIFCAAYLQSSSAAYFSALWTTFTSKLKTRASKINVCSSKP
jgi:hypothetical protein